MLSAAKCSLGNVVSGCIRFMPDIRRGSLERGSNQSGVVENGDFRFIRSLCSEHLHTWPHDSFQVIRLSMTLGIFQGHWTAVHQISQKPVCDTAKVTIDN